MCRNSIWHRLDKWLEDLCSEDERWCLESCTQFIDIYRCRIIHVYRSLHYVPSIPHLGSCRISMVAKCGRYTIGRKSAQMSHVPILGKMTRYICLTEYSVVVWSTWSPSMGETYVHCQWRAYVSQWIQPMSFKDVTSNLNGAILTVKVDGLRDSCHSISTKQLRPWLISWSDALLIH